MIVAGDLNDVAWSHTTYVSAYFRTARPRIGLKFINTFHASYPFCAGRLTMFSQQSLHWYRWRVCRNIGETDHFPVLTTLQYEPEVMDEQPEPCKHRRSPRGKRNHQRRDQEAKNYPEAQTDSANDAKQIHWKRAWKLAAGKIKLHVSICLQTDSLLRLVTNRATNYNELINTRMIPRNGSVGIAQDE